jgi:hypothetical protein
MCFGRDVELIASAVSGREELVNKLFGGFAEEREKS